MNGNKIILEFERHDYKNLAICLKNHKDFIELLQVCNYEKESLIRDVNYIQRILENAERSGKNG